MLWFHIYLRFAWNHPSPVVSNDLSQKFPHNGPWLDARRGATSIVKKKFRPFGTLSFKRLWFQVTSLSTRSYLKINLCITGHRKTSVWSRLGRSCPRKIVDTYFIIVDFLYFWILSQDTRNDVCISRRYCTKDGFSWASNLLRFFSTFLLVLISKRPFFPFFVSKFFASADVELPATQ